jgi:alkylation response protein AidB-like acyl-CoA dehydrogenase
VDFSENPDHRLIREAVRETCARFPDEYWAELGASHTFPWDFYAAMAKGGWIGIAIPAELGGGGCGITEASIVLEEVAASGVTEPDAGLDTTAIRIRAVRDGEVTYDGLYVEARDRVGEQGRGFTTCSTG